MDRQTLERLWLDHNQLAGAFSEGVALGLIDPPEPPASLDDLVNELRRLNDGLEYDRAIERWKRGEGRHPDD